MHGQQQPVCHILVRKPVTSMKNDQQGQEKNNLVPEKKKVHIVVNGPRQKVNSWLIYFQNQMHRVGQHMLGAKTGHHNVLKRAKDEQNKSNRVNRARLRLSTNCSYSGTSIL